MLSHNKEPEHKMPATTIDSKNDNPFNGITGYSGLVCPIFRVPYSSSDAKRRAIEVRETGSHYSQQFIIEWFYKQRKKTDCLTALELKNVPSDNFEKDLYEKKIFQYARALSEAAEQNAILIAAIAKFKPNLHADILRSLDDAKAHFQIEDNDDKDEMRVAFDEEDGRAVICEERTRNIFFLLFTIILLAFIARLNNRGRELAFQKEDSNKRFNKLHAHLDRSEYNNKLLRLEVDSKDALIRAYSNDIRSRDNKMNFCYETIEKAIYESVLVGQDKQLLRSELASNMTSAELMLRFFQLAPYSDIDKQFALWNAVSHCESDFDLTYITPTENNKPIRCLVELVRCNNDLKIAGQRCSLFEVNEQIEAETEYKNNSCIIKQRNIQNKIHKLQSDFLNHNIYMPRSTCYEDLKKCRYDTFLVSRSCLTSKNKQGQLKMKHRAQFLNTQMQNCGNDLQKLLKKNHDLNVYVNNERKNKKDPRGRYHSK